MSKKILLSTALSGAIMFASNAQATDYTVNFGGNNLFTIDGVEENNILKPFDLNSIRKYFKETAKFDDSKDKIALAEASRAPYFAAVSANTNNAKDSLIAFLAKEDGVTVEAATKTVNSILATGKELADTKHISQEDFVGILNFKNILVGDFVKFQELDNFLKNTKLLADNEADYLAKRNEVFDKLIAANEGKADFIAEINRFKALNAKDELVDGEKAEHEKLSAKIHSTDQYIEFIQSKENLEILKLTVNMIKSSQSASENSGLDKRSKEEVENLNSMLSEYIVDKPTTESKLTAVQFDDNSTTKAMSETFIANRELIDARMGDLAGVASGDIMETYGVWVKGSYTQATQKEIGNAQGYKLESKGGTIGIDTGDESLAGIAYSFYQSDVKNKAESKTKDKITSHTISAYGKYVVAPNIFVSAQGQYGMATIKKSRATGDAENHIATAKPKATTFGGKFAVGYEFAAGQGLSLIPTVGVAHTQVDVKGYTESGDGLNRTVAKMKSTRTSAVAGITAQYMADMGSMKLLPEVHANVDYAFTAKDSDTSVTLFTGMDPIVTPAQKAEKIRYNAGGSIKVLQSDMFEISGGYDFGFAKKFQSHTGTLKLRVNL